MSFSNPSDSRLLCIAERLVPKIAGLDEKGRNHFLSAVDASLKARPALMRRQLSLFLKIIHFLPLFFYGRSFEKLSQARQTLFLEWLQDCPLGIVRKGFWGLKTLVYLGYYGDPSKWQVWGYTPSKNGNEKL